MSDHPTRLAAALEGRYTIERELGEGGMATVYLAEDLKHHRKVALKVLKPELAAVVGAERFLAEIETTANLQHPHILPLFDSGEADSFLYYVMPYVEGESLRARLDRDRQLPVDEAIRIATDLAEALDYAHRQKVVHRDIKPANILLHEGRPVIADFGIALAVGAAGGARLTETGLSVGTPYYMSPEQATGDSFVGPQSDMYALGCVLFEMLVGEPPYPGATAQAVLGRIIAGGPVSATPLRPTIPANVDAAIRRVLEKLPADRFATAQEFAKALKDPGFTHGEDEAAAAQVGRSAGPWMAATIVLAISTGALAFMSLRGPAVESQGVLRYELELPVGFGANSDFGSNVTISPDGRTIVYSGMTEDSERPGLWVRTRDRLDPVEIPGTDFGVQPTFSPDGTQVAFISDDRALKVVSLSGRPPLTLYSSPRVRRGGVSWGDDGYIYFAQWAGDTYPAPLYRIPEDGGDLESVTTADTTSQEIAHYFPDVLPGSRLVLFTRARESEYTAETRDIAVANVETGDVTVLLQGIQAIWSNTGHILVVRADGALIAAPFDPSTLEVGPATPVFEGMEVEPLVSADVAISDDGTLLYTPGGVVDQESRMAVWVDRSGNVAPVDPNWPGRYLEPRISPDGARLAITSIDGSELHVWVKELDTGPQAKLTFQGRVNRRPVWTADGTDVAFVSNRGENQDVYRRRADAAAPAELMLDVDGVTQQLEFTRDGEWMVVRIGDDIYAQRTEPEADLLPLLADPDVREVNFALSPDGRWIAYASNESGEFNIYVRPFPNVNDGKWPVSTATAVSPRWAPDGRELFYKTVNRQFMAASIIAGTTFIVGERTALFSIAGMLSTPTHAQYDVHPDGDRFVMIQLDASAEESPLVVIEGFFEELSPSSGN